MVYQEYAYFPTDSEGFQYQTGVFYAEEPAGLAFRRSKGIIDNLAQVVGHTVK
jgi:glutathionylspermidine synthase